MTDFQSRAHTLYPKICIEAHLHREVIEGKEESNG